MGPQSLSNILWAFAKLGVLPERSWLNAFFAASLQVGRVCGCCCVGVGFVWVYCMHQAQLVLLEGSVLAEQYGVYPGVGDAVSLCWLLRGLMSCPAIMPL
jgi:hypothetical protein